MTRVLINQDSVPYLVKVGQSLLNNSNCPLKIVFSYYKWRGEANARIHRLARVNKVNFECIHVDMGRLCQHPTVLEEKTELPGRPFLDTLRFVDNNSVQQSFATNELYVWRIDRANR